MDEAIIEEFKRSCKPTAEKKNRVKKNEVNRKAFFYYPQLSSRIASTIRVMETELSMNSERSFSANTSSSTLKPFTLKLTSFLLQEETLNSTEELYSQKEEGARQVDSLLLKLTTRTRNEHNTTNTCNNIESAPNASQTQPETQTVTRTHPTSQTVPSLTQPKNFSHTHTNTPLSQTLNTA